MVDFKKLKSGSDIRGTAWADSGEVSLSDPVVYDIVRGFVSFICEKLGKGPGKLTVLWETIPASRARGSTAASARR